MQRYGFHAHLRSRLMLRFAGRDCYRCAPRRSVKRLKHQPQRRASVRVHNDYGCCPVAEQKLDSERANVSWICQNREAIKAINDMGSFGRLYNFRFS